MVNANTSSFFRPAYAEAKARSLLHSYGRNSMAWKILNPKMTLWFSRNDRGVIGYQQYRNTRIVAGAPVTDIGLMNPVAQEFEEDAAAKGQTVCYFCAESWLTEFLKNSARHKVILLGAHPVWNPQKWTESLSSKKSVGELIQHARRRGVQVEEVSAETAFSHPSYRRCLKEWLKKHRLPRLGFLVDPAIPAPASGLRFFAALKESRVIAFAVIAPVPARNGWLIEHLIRGFDAAKGTTELLIHQVMTLIAKEGSTYATLGLAPLSRQAGLSYKKNPAWLKAFFCWLYSGGNLFFSFRGLDTFKAKFNPLAWEPVYAIVNKPRFTPSTLYHVAGAFCRMSPPLFLLSAAVRTLLPELD